MKKILLTSLICSMAIISYGQSKFDYNAAWKKIDELIHVKDLPKSALIEVNKVYQIATKEKAYPEQIRALIQKNTLESSLSSDFYKSAIDSLKKEIEMLEMPAKAVAQSLLADQYREYYYNNRWNINNRTTTDIVEDDFLTWNTNKLFDEIVKNYYLSVSQKGELLKHSTKDYMSVMVDEKAKGVEYRPTLYDFLVGRALNAFSGNDFSVHKPIEEFKVKEEYFVDLNKFINLKLSPADESSNKYQTLKLYQEWLKTNINKGSDKVIVDIELNRLRYLQKELNNDVIYEKELKHLYENYNSEGGDILHEIASIYYNRGLKFRETNNDRDGLVKAYNLCKEIKEKYPQSLAAKDYVASFMQEIEKTNVEIVLENSNPANSPIKYKVDYANAKTINIAVYSLESKDYLHYKGPNMHSPNYNKGKKVYNQNVNLLSKDDYQKYSTELALSGLDLGFYSIVISHGEKDYAAKFQVSNLATIKIETPNRLEVRDRVTGEKLEGVKVSFYRDYNKAPIKTEITDKDGKVNLSLKERTWVNGLLVEKAKDKLFANEHIYYTRDPQDNTYTSTTFFTDRAIYRPGQTVYFKGLVLSKNNNYQNIVTNKPYTVEFYDVNHQKISSLNVKTNEFGSFNGNFVIPQGLLNGNMTIRTSDHNGAINIRVEEYKRPTFEVKIETPEQEIALESKVELKGNAKALAGYAVDEAKVQYRVVRKTMFPYRYWFFPPNLSADKEIANGFTQTNEKGDFAIPFITEEGDDKNEMAIYNYHVTADVTDPNGETQSTTYILKASRKPLIIKSTIPNLIDLYTKNSPLSYNLSTESLNGKEIESDVEIEIVELNSPQKIFRKNLWKTPDTFMLDQKEFENLFPLDDYSGENTNPEKYVEGKVIATINQNTSKTGKIDLSKLKGAKKEWYRIKIKAKSKQGVIVESKQNVRIMSLTAPISNMDDWLQIVKSEAKVNENAIFLLSGNEGGLVYYSVYNKDGKETQKGEIKVDKHPKELIIPIKEVDRGGFGINFSMLHNNRLYSKTQHVTVPWDDKKLDISFKTFRDKLKPGSQEKWLLSVKNDRGNAVLAEMVAGLYDASLDSFVPHSWGNIDAFYPQNFLYGNISSANINELGGSNLYGYRGYRSQVYINRNYPILLSSQFDLNTLDEVLILGYGRSTKATVIGTTAGIAPVTKQELALDQSSDNVNKEYSGAGADLPQEEVTVNQNIDIRTNFNETAFFYPELRTNEKGELVIEFTIPEALTRWKMLGFAHTKDFKVGNITNELITQKEVAISANAPRFFREGDQIVFTAKVNNITQASINAQTYIELFDAVSMKNRNDLVKTANKQNITIDAEQSATVSWSITIPEEGLQAITYRVYAEAGKHSDGEEKTIPVLPNSMLVTETMPFMLRSNETKDFTFNRLSNVSSNTLRNHSLTLEFTSNPAWYAVQSLPYIMEYPYECSEQTFARFFANTLASTIVNSNPSIKRIFDLWSTLPNSEAFYSQLEKNQELKQVLLEETPWVMNAQNESERKKRMGLLFDLNKLSQEAGRTIKILQKNQNSDGGFPWFEGYNSSQYITQHIVSGFAKLKKLNAIPEKYSSEINIISNKALAYLDKEYAKEYNDLKNRENVDLKKLNTNSIHLHYIYSALYSNHTPKTVAYKYHYDQAIKYWTSFGVYEQGLIAFIAHKTNNIVAKDIVNSLKEKAIQSEDLGMYWKTAPSYFWNEAPIETQALMIDVFAEVAKDEKVVEELKLWLLLNKQTTHWKSTKATTEAIYALLSSGKDIISDTKMLDITVGTKSLTELKPDLKAEPGTGYVKTSWGDFDKSMAKIKANNPNNGPAWGGMYWQYYEQLDKITSAETNIKIKRDLFIKRNTDKGPVLIPLDKETPKVGDVITVRMELRANRDFEYVHLKDARASNLEPVSTTSGYRFKNGLGYYENIKDASTNFFINYLRKGTYVFEYDLRVTHKGDFSNGISTFQCMYAPEFNSHSQGVRVKVE